MLKTIIVNKRMRLDELIKYAWENDIKNKLYYSDNGQIVKFLGDGNFETGWDFGYHDSFSVRIEEEFTKDTEFEYLLAIYITKDLDKRPIAFEHKTINEILGTVGQYYQIYAMIDGKLEIIWERR